MDVDSALSAPMRRRQRRLRQYLRHERLSVAMVLAEKLHHTSRGQRFAGAGEEGHEEHDALRRQRPPPHPAFFQLFDEEDAELGARPGSVTDPVPHGRVERQTVEHRIEACPFVQILDAPVPQMGDQLVELLQKIVTASLVELVQVVAVPKSPWTASRSVLRYVVVRWRSSWWMCQLNLGMRWQSLPRSPTQGVRSVVFSQDRVQQRLVQSSSLILQFLRVGGGLPEVFKVFSQIRVQKQRTWSRTLIFELAEVFEVFFPDRVQMQRTWSRSLTFQLAVVFKVLSQARGPQLPHRVNFIMTRMKEFKGFFALFHIFFNAGMCPHSGSELPPESSSSTRRACAVPMVPEEEESVTESESEVEEDCDIWLDGVGRQWMRTAAFPGRWYLLGTLFDGSIWWDGPGWGSWVAPLGSRWLSGFCCPSMCNDRCHGGTDWARVPLHASVYSGFWVNFLHFSLARFTLGNMVPLSSWSRIRQSCSQCLGIACGVQSLDSLGDAAFIWGAMLGSTHVLHQYKTLYGRISHRLYVEWTRILRCFSSFAGRMEKCVQSMLQVA